MIREAELVDRGPVAGTMVLRPDGKMQDSYLDEPFTCVGPEAGSAMLLHCGVRVVSSVHPQDERIARFLQLQPPTPGQSTWTPATLSEEHMRAQLEGHGVLLFHAAKAAGSRRGRARSPQPPQPRIETIARPGRADERPLRYTCGSTAVNCCLQLARNRIGKFDVGSVLCMQIVELMPSGTVEVLNCDAIKREDMPSWLIGTPTLVAASGSDIYRGQHAVMHLQRASVTLASRRAAPGPTDARRRGCCKAQRRAPRQGKCARSFDRLCAHGSEAVHHAPANALGALARIVLVTELLAPRLQSSGSVYSP